MSAQSDFIDYFQLNATFDPDTRSTREFIQSSDPKRQVITVKEWKRQAEPIGHRGSAIVWLEHNEDGTESRAIKQILKATPTTPLQTDYRRELQALGRLSRHHDHFVNFYGWFESDTSISLAMEYFELGDLEKFITSKMTENDAKVIGRQLLEGLQVLHGYHLAHRDLKPANIFVVRCAPDWWIKLGDFGIVRRICTENSSELSRIGTVDYMAPEILLETDDEDQDLSYTLAVDIWSLGCVLFRLLTQQLPFNQARHLRLYWRSKKPFPTDILINHHVSKDGVFLVSEMMKSNPADRMTITMALVHSWFSIQNSTTTSGYFARSHSKFCRDQEAMRLETQTLELRKSALGDEHPDTLQCMNALARSYFELGQIKEAMQLYAQTLELQKRVLGDEHPNTLQSMNALAISYSDLGRNEKAMQLYTQTLELRKHILGDEHPETLESMHNLALYYSHLGRDQEAMHLAIQTLELRKRALGDEHPDTLCSMHDLATSFSKLGQNQEAVQLYTQTFELRKRALGHAHPDTLYSMYNLAESYSKLGRNDEAMQLDKQTLELRKRVLGDEHPDTLCSMYNLAESYSKLGRNEEAMQLDTQTLELRKRTLGDAHPDTLNSLYNLAKSYSKLGQDQEAIQLYTRTLESRQRVLGNEHPDTLQSMEALAGSYSKLGQHLEAIRLGKQTLEARRRILGPAHPATIFSIQQLAWIIRDKKVNQSLGLRMVGVRPSSPPSK